MEYRICPICDQKMTGAHYCVHCRQWIRNPLTINVNYYLNERHPDTEHDCSYHDYDDPAYKMPSPQTVPNQAARTAVPNRPVRKVIPNQPRRTAQASGTGGRNILPAVVIAIFIIAMCVITVFFSLFKAIQDWIPDDIALSADSLDELLEQWDPGADNGDYEDVEYKSWELDESDVASAGVNCNSYGHFSVTGEQMASGLADAILDMGYSAGSDDSFSTNTEDSFGYTSFNKYRYYTFSSGDSLSVISDTATDQLHSVSISWADPDEALQIAKTVTALMRDSGDWTLSEAETAAWLDNLKNRLPELEYESVTPEGLGSGIDIFVASYESDNYYISFNNWGD